MVKWILFLRIGSWALGALLALVSALWNSHGNSLLWNIAKTYNTVISLSSLVPVALIALTVDLAVKKREVAKHLGGMALVAVCFFAYIGIWILCTGGV